MESFAVHSVGNRTLSELYKDIQAVQTLLFKMLITGCSSAKLSVCPTGLSITRSKCSAYVTSMTVISIPNSREVTVNMSLLTRALSMDIQGRYVVSSILYNLQEQLGHYGGALFDTENKTFSIFDPSYSVLIRLGVANNLVDAIERETGYEYVIIPCPMDFQHETNDEFCSMWTMMVMYLTCSSSLSIIEVVQRLFELSVEQLRDEIGGFIVFSYDLAIREGLRPVIDRINKFGILVIKYPGMSRDVALGIIDDVKFSDDPLEYIDSLDLFEERQYDAIDLYANSNVVDSILLLEQPMSDPVYQAGVEMVYRERMRGTPSVIYLYNMYKKLYADVSFIYYDLIELSRVIKFEFNRARVAALSSIIQDKFSDFYRIPREGHKMMNFIFEFYLRYLFLDTWDVEGYGVDLSDFRLDKYEAQVGSMGLGNFDLSLLVTIMGYVPIRYVNLELFISTVEVPVTDDGIITAMLASSLIHSPSSDRIFRGRLVAVLELIRALVTKTLRNR